MEPSEDSPDRQPENLPERIQETLGKLQLLTTALLANLNWIEHPKHPVKTREFAFEVEDRTYIVGQIGGSESDSGLGSLIVERGNQCFEIIFEPSGIHLFWGNAKSSPTERSSIRIPKDIHKYPDFTQILLSKLETFLVELSEVANVKLSPELLQTIEEIRARMKAQRFIENL